jgi:S1-C subfamily serine protease
MRPLSFVSFGVACAMLGIAGCANPYGQFYQPAAAPMADAPHILPSTTPPRLASLSGNPEQDVVEMYEQGYGIVGTVSFNGPAASQADVIDQAKKVGAEVVLVSSAYQNTISGSIPVTTPTVSTSYNSGTVNAIGAGGGMATGTYSGTTTNYGTQTNNIPYSIDRYSQQAVFFGPVERKGVGLLCKRPSDDQKRIAGTNQFLVVSGVRQGSPGFKADILPGDFLLSYGGHPMYDMPAFHSAIAEGLDTPEEVVLLRAGTRITKTVQVPSTW